MDNPQHRELAAFLSSLIAHGLRDVVFAPGSRSTPVLLTFRDLGDVRLWPLLDERSAAFFALGMAKATGRPAAVVCTSGTAAANLLPAVVESRHAFVPLLVLTADRPRELRDVGVNQTIDQRDLFGRHARWSLDLPLEGAEQGPAYARQAAARAMATASAEPGGPVHVNLPLREPLMPSHVERAQGSPELELGGTALGPTPQALARARDLLAKHRRGIIVAGSVGLARPAEALSLLSESTGYPVLADPLSGYRTGGGPAMGRVAAYDRWMHDTRLQSALRPDLVLRVGKLPVSKSLGTFLEGLEAPTLYLPGVAGWEATLLRPGLVLPGRVEDVLDGLLEPPAPPPATGFKALWTSAGRAAQAALHRWLAEREGDFEGLAVSALEETLCAGDLLFVGNSMPVRLVDAFYPPGGSDVTILANRGVSGIDGVISTALGAAAVSGRHVTLLIGDLSFAHDLTGLFAAYCHSLSLTVLLIHNDGGGIFSQLPQVADPDFEALFATPHGLDFSPAVLMYGGHFTRCSGRELSRTLRSARAAGGLQVVEMGASRAETAARMREAADVAARAARAALVEGRG